MFFITVLYLQIIHCTTLIFRHLYVVIIGALAFLGCDSVDSERPNTSQIFERTSYDTVSIIHGTFDLSIQLEGRLYPWKESKILLPDTTILIAYLAKPGDFVKRGDLLASVWSKSEIDEFTPIDIHATIDGIIEKARFKLNEKIPANQPITIIKNYDNLVLQDNKNEEQMRYLKKNQKVTLFSDSIQFSGTVNKVDLRNNSVSVWVENNESNLKSEVVATGEIYCGQTKGDYINDFYFSETNTVEVVLDEGIKLDLTKLGKSDTLALFHPPLPNQKFVKIFKKNLDLIK